MKVKIFENVQAQINAFKMMRRRDGGTKSSENVLHERCDHFQVQWLSAKSYRVYNLVQLFQRKGVSLIQVPNYSRVDDMYGHPWYAPNVVSICPWIAEERKRGGRGVGGSKAKEEWISIMASVLESFLVERLDLVFDFESPDIKDAEKSVSLRKSFRQFTNRRGSYFVRFCACGKWALLPNYFLHDFEKHPDDDFSEQKMEMKNALRIYDAFAQSASIVRSIVDDLIYRPFPRKN